jgi:hypothetical protein
MSPAGRSARAQFTASALLLLQYLLGMAVNLFIVIPRRHPGAGASNYFTGVVSGLEWAIPHGPLWLAAHAALGLALVIAALWAVLAAIRSASRIASATSIVAALAIIGAGFNGASFLNYGHNFSSMIMAGLLAVALGSYLIGLYHHAGLQHVASRGIPGPGRQ